MPTLRTGSEAFTLVELLVVVVIIAVLTAMVAAPIAGHFSSTKLRQSSQEFLLVLQHARHDAVARGRRCSVVLDRQENRYMLREQPSVVSETVTADQASGTPMERWHALAGGVSFGQVLIRGRWERQDATGDRVTFDPSGEADEATIELTDGQRVWSIRVASSTGRTEIMQGRASQMLIERQDLDG